LFRIEGERMPKKTQRVTAAQVARHSGVSQATVSYVLNDNPSQKISEETRARVLKSVAELGYTPFEAARTLRSGTSSVVLFVVPDYPVGHVMVEVSDRLVELLAREGRTLLTHRLATGVPLLPIVRSLRPLAVISMAPLDADLRARIEALGAQVEIIGFRSASVACRPTISPSGVMSAWPMRCRTTIAPRCSRGRGSRLFRPSAPSGGCPLLRWPRCRPISIAPAGSCTAGMPRASRPSAPSPTTSRSP
jgi:transcriptional regulator with XRE-family HTH domain